MNLLNNKNIKILKRFSSTSTSTLIPWSIQNNIKQPQIIKADNSFIFTKNKKIVDFTSGAMVVNLGHNNKYIQTAFKETINNGIAYVPSNFSTKQRDYLSERLLEEANIKNGKVFYCNAGADANEFACFISNEYHYYTNNNKYNIKNRILSFEKSFHGGSTIAASLLSGDKRRNEKKKYYNIPFEPILENPKLEDNGKMSLNNINRKFLNNNNISGVVLEGSSGTAGCILYPDNYLKSIEKLCNQNDIILICDEVMSGFGRTGDFFAHSKHNIKPNIITCAKGITSGYTQLGAVILDEKVSEIFNEIPFMGGLTYSGHPLSCLIANKCMDLYLYNNSELIRNVNNKGDILNNKCQKLVVKYNFIKEYRNNGLLGCFEFDLNNNMLVLLSELLLEHGIYCLRIRQNIFTAPPLNIDDELIIETIKKMDLVFDIFNDSLIFNQLSL